MTKKEIKEKIWTFEYYTNGFHKLSGAGVSVKNLKISGDKIRADIILTTDAEAGISERYNNCRYDLGQLKKIGF